MYTIQDPLVELLGQKDFYKSLLASVFSVLGRNQAHR